MNIYLNECQDFSNSKKDKIIEKLKMGGQLRYEGLISDLEIGEIFSTRKKLESDKDWTFMVLNLMQIINNLGYFTTTRGRNGSIYILKREEMSDFNENQNNLAYQNLRRRQRGLNMIDPTVLTHNQASRLDFEILRNGHLQTQMSTSLKERCRV